MRAATGCVAAQPRLLDVRPFSESGIVNLRLDRILSVTKPLPCACYTTTQAAYRSDGTAGLPISACSHGVLVVCLSDIPWHKVSIKPVAPQFRPSGHARVCVHGPAYSRMLQLQSPAAPVPRLKTSVPSSVICATQTSPQTSVDLFHACFELENVGGE